MPTEVETLMQRVDELEARLTLAVADIQALRHYTESHTKRLTIFDKAFRAVGLWGDYLEFGTFRGDSFAHAYAAASSVYHELVSGSWDHAFDDGVAAHEQFHRAWSDIRFIGFDSFEGIPEPKGIDKTLEVFKGGTYSFGESAFMQNIVDRGVDPAKVQTVKGYFEDTLNIKTAEMLNLQRIAVVHIDSDLYESACLALDFVAPFLIDGAVVIFDEWYQFMGSPYKGERRAFLEWCKAHPEWVVSGFHKEGAFRNSFILSKREGEQFIEHPTALFS